MEKLSLLVVVHRVTAYADGAQLALEPAPDHDPTVHHNAKLWKRSKAVLAMQERARAHDAAVRLGKPIEDSAPPANTAPLDVQKGGLFMWVANTDHVEDFKVGDTLTVTIEKRT